MQNIKDRVGRIVSGSINALMESIEEATPEIVLEETVREIDAAIDDVRAELGHLTADKHMANKRLADTSSKHDILSGQIALALEQQREDLAEAAIASQMDLEAQVPVLEHKIADLGEEIERLEGYIAALKGKRSEMVEEIKAFLAKQKAAESPATIAANGSPAHNSDVAARVEKASNVFDKITNRTSLTSLGNSDNAEKLAELEKLARDTEVKRRLEAIKGSN